MEQSPKICPKCQQANFPIAEFCRHCGEAIFDLGVMSRSSTLTRFSGYLVDGLFWFFEEAGRWWEVGRISRSLKTCERRRAKLMNRIEEETGGEEAVGGADKDRLVEFTEEISRLTVQAQTLRRRSWAYTPELMFVGIVLLFIWGILWLNPRTSGFVPPPAMAGALDFSRGIVPTQEFAISGHSIVTCALWFDQKLFIGGDRGLVTLDPVSGQASSVVGLPEKFFVRHLAVDGARLLIAGYGGVFALDPTGITSLFDPDQLTGNFINRILPVPGGQLLGTVGYGLMQGRNRLATLILGTQGLTIQAMTWFNDELWLLHERGLMKGVGSRYTPVTLPALADRTFTSMAAATNGVYIGTNQGILGAFYTENGWVWSPLASSPRDVTDLISPGAGLVLACAADGLYRMKDGIVERLAAVSGQKVLTLGRDFLVSAGPGKAIFYRPSGVPGAAPVGSSSVLMGTPVVAPLIPSVGTFTPGLDAGTDSAIIATPPQSPLPTSSGNSQSPAGNPTPITSGNVQPATSDPLFQGSQIPPGLLGPFVTSLAWDGRQLWVGTLKDGIWAFRDGNWSHFNVSGGQLTDNQISGLYAGGGKAWAISWIMGLLGLDSGSPKTLVPAERMQGLLALATEDSSPWLLFKDGTIRRFNDAGGLEEVTRVTEDFFHSVRTLNILNGKPHVGVNDGVLSLEAGGRWVVTFFPEPVGDARPLLTTVDSRGVLYLALSDGKVFSYQQRRLSNVGSIRERPRGMAWVEGSLWLLWQNTLHRLGASGFSAVSLPFSGPFQSLVAMPEKQLLAILTEGGLKGFKPAQ